MTTASWFARGINSQTSYERDFSRHQLDNSELLDLFLWRRPFLERTAGSPIRRIGYARWRQSCRGAGNAPHDPAIIQALRQQRDAADAMLAEHIDWAIAQQCRNAELLGSDR